MSRRRFFFVCIHKALKNTTSNRRFYKRRFCFTIGQKSYRVTGFTSGAFIFHWVHFGRWVLHGKKGK